MRSDYAFLLFSGGLQAPVLVARSNVVTFVNLVPILCTHLWNINLFIQKNEPLKPRLSTTLNPSEMK